LRPKYSFGGRIYAIAASDESVEACAQLGGDVRRPSLAAAHAGNQPSQ
jgi:hypothetical protein